MKLKFFDREDSDRAQFFRETAARRNLSPVMVEKDFWVSWTLAILFSHPEFRDQLVFKGGTSLSKVFGVIERFSEDIDLSVSPAFLGISEESGEQAHSRRKKEEWDKNLEDICIERVRNRFLPELEQIACDALGNRKGSLMWMEFIVDESTNSPIVLFHYPSAEPSEFTYLPRSVKMEFGSLTDQKPAGIHSVKSWVGEMFPDQFDDFRCELVALGLERTFWEKATILHMEYHRDLAKPIETVSRDIIQTWPRWLGTLSQNARWLAVICGSA